MDSDDDMPQLSADTFAALQQFYKEQEERENQLKSNETNNIPVEENWQLSQFWYDENTIKVLVDIAVKTAGETGKIALISCPSLYTSIREKLGDKGEVTLFEYDHRFSIYNDFIPYDYKSPLNIPREKSGYYDVVLADPPFLSEECLTKTAVTAKFLTKHKILLCTGATMANLANRLLDLRKTSLEPKHKNNLANEFCCFTNFEVESL